MEYFQELTQLWTSGLNYFFSLDAILLIIFGSIIGLSFGSLPGLSSTMALAVFTPLTFGLNSHLAIMFLISMYASAIYGGALSAIIVNIPGTPSSIASGFDGYQMTKKGKSGFAIGIATISSVFGGLLGLIALMIFSPLIVLLARKFGSWEYAILALMGITLISYISQGSIVKGLIGGTLGLLIASIGQDPIIAYPRFHFGTTELLGGINVVIVLIGLFGVAEVLQQIEKEDKKAEIVKKSFSIFKDIRDSLKEVLSNWVCVLRSSIIGVFIGAIPAAGPSIASLTSYGIAKRFSKNRRAFGSGSSEGLVAAESANNASMGGTLIPMMTLGIPGDPMTAVLIGALMLHRLTPGPTLFTDHPQIVSTIYITFGLGLICVLVGGLIFSKILAKLIALPKYYVMAVVLLLCLVGGFSIANSIFDMAMVVVFGIIGYILQKADISPAPIVLGVVLGGMFESNLRRALMLGDGSLLPFLTRPLSLILLAITVSILISAFIQYRKDAEIMSEESM